MVETIQTRKSLGQHILKDPLVCERIADIAELDPHDLVIEIGPGTGRLTQFLLSRVRKVIAIEFDRRMIELLKARKPAWQDSCGAQLEIVQADVLRFHFGAVASTGRAKVVGNLPYNISTRLLIKMTKAADSFHSLTVMIQKEVAERILAAPRCKDYGYLTLLMQFHFQVAAGFDVPPGAFYPRPRVVSHVLQLIPLRPARPIQNYEGFVRLIQQAFAQRRKTLWKNLGRMIPDRAIREKAFRKCAIGRMMRAEEVSLQQFLCLADMLS